MTDLDFSARYTVRGYRGVAFYADRYETEQVYDGDVLLCEDEDCDHQLSEMCWMEGDYETVTNKDRVVVVMVGDDYERTVDVDDLTVIPEDDYCAECGQIGCTADGREREDA